MIKKKKNKTELLTSGMKNGMTIEHSYIKIQGTPHKTLHTDVQSSFIHSCQNVEANKRFLNK
jgi:hypothetical protein